MHGAEITVGYGYESKYFLITFYCVLFPSINYSKLQPVIQGQTILATGRDSVNRAEIGLVEQALEVNRLCMCLDQFCVSKFFSVTLN